MSARLHDGFTAQAQRRPEAIAVVHRDRALTYGALETMSNQLAHLLVALGCRPSSSRASAGKTASIKARRHRSRSKGSGPRNKYTGSGPCRFNLERNCSGVIRNFPVSM